LSNKIQLYRMGKDPQAALETKDITGDAVAAVIEHVMQRPGQAAEMRCDYQGKPVTFLVQVEKHEGHGALPAVMSYLKWEKANDLSPCSPEAYWAEQAWNQATQAKDPVAVQLLREVLNEVPHGWGASFADSDLYARIEAFVGKEPV